jgi:hypothetical protein
MKKSAVTPPDIYADRLASLSLQERAALRDFMATDLFLKFMRIVECKKPSAFAQGTTGSLVDGNALIRSTITLSEIRGWEEHRNAMLVALLDPPAPKQKVEISYQEP